jgi:hypothetical protein
VKGAAAYGFSSLSLDGTGQTITIVDTYDNPNIYQALDTFDSQFGQTANGPTLYQQYGAASAFLTVLNQQGKPTGLPGPTRPAPARPTGSWKKPSTSSGSMPSLRERRSSLSRPTVPRYRT